MVYLQKACHPRSKKTRVAAKAITILQFVQLRFRLAAWREGLTY